MMPVGRYVRFGYRLCHDRCCHHHRQQRLGADVPLELALVAPVAAMVYCCMDWIPARLLSRFLICPIFFENDLDRFQ